MAGIGLYGVFYSKAKVKDGVLTGYSGCEMMGKAISATFTPVDSADNKLYANNSVAESDAQAGAGGNLDVTLDALKKKAIEDIFGLTSKEYGEEKNKGTGFDYTGQEQSNPVGVAFIRQSQENQNRDIHEAVIFSYATFKQPSEEYQTLEDGVDWQTPSISAVVSGGAITGELPWKKVYTFSSQAAAIAFIEDYFKVADDEA